MGVATGGGGQWKMPSTEVIKRVAEIHGFKLIRGRRNDKNLVEPTKIKENRVNNNVKTNANDRTE
jgi:hypothetical protein